MTLQDCNLGIGISTNLLTLFSPLMKTTSKGKRGRFYRATITTLFTNTMIDAADLTYADIRLQYVLPLLDEIIQKSGLAGIVTNIEKLPSDPSNSSTLTGTLFDDIAADGRDCSCNTKSSHSTGSGSSIRCYHEVSRLGHCTVVAQESMFLFLRVGFANNFVLSPHQTSRSLKKHQHYRCT